MMKAPPPSLESYMNAMLKPSATAGSLQAGAAMMNEMNKLRQLQAKKNELMQQMQQIDAQIFKVQGALEVLQSLGLTSK